MIIPVEIDQEDNLCPKCKVDRQVLWGILHDDYDSDNYQQALRIVWNCKACRQWLDDKMGLVQHDGHLPYWARKELDDREAMK